MTNGKYRKTSRETTHWHFRYWVAAYWQQFERLKRLTGYLHLIEEGLGQWGEVV